MKPIEKYLFCDEIQDFNCNRIYNAISKLPEDNQKAIWLHFIKEKSRKEIAVQLNWSLSKVNQKITRGITLLKIELNPEYFQDADKIMEQTAQRLLSR